MTPDELSAIDFSSPPGVSRRNLIAILAASGAITMGASALGAPFASADYVQYQHPFNNPDLADGWGSTLGRSSPHRGLDYPQPAGKAIPAAATGRVVVRTWNSALGNVVVLSHADGYYSGYCHMQSASPLSIGSTVSRGSTVGKVGDTGSASEGNHLHLTISQSASGYYTGTTVDPYPFINARLGAGSAPTNPTTPTNPTNTEDDDMQMIVLYADTAQGSEYGSTAVITAHRGFVRTSTGMGPRNELQAWVAVAGACGYQITEKHVDTNGYLLAQRL